MRTRHERSRNARPAGHPCRTPPRSDRAGFRPASRFRGARRSCPRQRHCTLTDSQPSVDAHRFSWERAVRRTSASGAAPIRPGRVPPREPIPRCEAILPASPALCLGKANVRDSRHGSPGDERRRGPRRRRGARKPDRPRRGRRPRSRRSGGAERAGGGLRRPATVRRLAGLRAGARPDGAGRAPAEAEAVGRAPAWGPDRVRRRAKDRSRGVARPPEPGGGRVRRRDIGAVAPGRRGGVLRLMRPIARAPFADSPAGGG